MSALTRFVLSALCRRLPFHSGARHQNFLWRFPLWYLLSDPSCLFLLHNPLLFLFRCSAAVSAVGEVMTWGCGTHGQLVSP